MSTEPALMTLTAVAKAIAEKKLSSHEVTRAVLHRIAEWQPRLNAYMAIESEQALAAASEADAELAKGKSRGALHGVFHAAHEKINLRADRLSDGGETFGCDILGADQTHGRLHQDF